MEFFELRMIARLYSMLMPGWNETNWVWFCSRFPGSPTTTAAPRFTIKRDIAFDFISFRPRLKNRSIFQVLRYGRWRRLHLSVIIKGNRQWDLLCNVASRGGGGRIFTRTNLGLFSSPFWGPALQAKEYATCDGWNKERHAWSNAVRPTFARPFTDTDSDRLLVNLFFFSKHWTVIPTIFVKIFFPIFKILYINGFFITRSGLSPCNGLIRLMNFFLVFSTFQMTSDAFFRFFFIKKKKKTLFMNSRTDMSVKRHAMREKNYQEKLYSSVLTQCGARGLLWFIFCLFQAHAAPIIIIANEVACLKCRVSPKGTENPRSSLLRGGGGG